ncbi:TPA: hypothetical protein ACYSGK_002572 [Escherichia coli]|uniref:hypothetical protein n=1 Tax=Escherichia coli TaxID=562 RepID=UPI0018EE67FE|nr:hypothetical protein [Escherichia coli]MCF2288540.1 hypothetical protein [Escherichia coli]MCJ8686564.1 hypothetical protein [Escherichia coli]MCX3221911.1 hypothetical protein [Escherichia coli]QQG53328.1 hypothetical protein IB009_13050 [Escherichia coli]CAK0691520.1 hypothetical protein FGAF637_18770 [Escherichia coli]
MFEERLETIRSVCENLKLQTKPALRIKSKRQVITSHKPKVRKIPSWCLDKLPCDAQILGDDGMYSYVYH